MPSAFIWLAASWPSAPGQPTMPTRPGKSIWAGMTPTIPRHPVQPSPDATQFIDSNNGTRTRSLSPFFPAR